VHQLEKNREKSENRAEGAGEWNSEGGSSS